LEKSNAREEYLTNAIANIQGNVHAKRTKHPGHGGRYQDAVLVHGSVHSQMGRCRHPGYYHPGRFWLHADRRSCAGVFGVKGKGTSGNEMDMGAGWKFDWSTLPWLSVVRIITLN